jgi:Fe-S cluster assembly iron-binding protein IscA
MKYKKILFLMMLSCSSFAAHLPACDDNKVIDEVRQQNKMSVVANLMGSKNLNDSSINDISKQLKGLDVKLKNITDLHLKNDSGLLVCRTEIGLFIGDKLKKDDVVLYVIEKDKNDPDKFQVKSKIAAFN